MLASVFHECDLLIAECLALGLLDGVDAPVLAGLLSVFVYEHRSPEPPAPPWFPDAAARQRWRRIVAVSEDLAAEERAAGLAPTVRPTRGSSPPPTAGRPGTRSSTVVGDEELTGGDFVRTMKQLIDLARQVADVAPSAATRAVAREVAELALPRHRRRRRASVRRRDGRQAGRAVGRRRSRRSPTPGRASRRRRRARRVLSSGDDGRVRCWSAAATCIARSARRPGAATTGGCRST